MAPRKDIKPILSVKIRSEHDIVLARQRGRQIAALMGFAASDQAAMATAVSEIARNAFQYAGGGACDFGVESSGDSSILSIEIRDEGPGIADLEAVLSGQYQSPTGLGLGLAGTRRLTDRFEITSTGSGTSVRFGKIVPASKKAIHAARIAAQLANEPRPAVHEELQEQNRELLRAFEHLREREQELEARRAELDRLNLELEETNRGVVALYGELEERAGALRRANELKSQFLSHVSHEFRTPLNSIMALTHLLLRRTDGDLTTEQEKQVTFVRQAASGLSDMVNDLLDLAKVESGKTEIRMASVDIGQVLGAVRALMRPLATNEAVALIFEEAPARLSIETDEAKLGQILRNLVSNALKFTERGEVRVSARVEGPETIVFSVSDTGIGIAPEDRENVFAEFTQIHHSLQKRVKGTGLGLSLSRKLAGLMGGTLELFSEVGVGSTFVLKLPLCQPAASKLPEVCPAEPAGGTILIVDDEEASRYLGRQIFRGSAYRAIESGGLEAAERARFERPRLILLDLIMPGRTGFEVLDELHSDPSTREIPVVIHTSKTITDADLHRLGGRHLTILAKAGAGRRQAMEAIRAVLNDQTLFAGEPEFTTPAAGQGV